LIYSCYLSNGLISKFLLIEIFLVFKLTLRPFRHRGISEKTVRKMLSDELEFASNCWCRLNLSAQWLVLLGKIHGSIELEVIAKTRIEKFNGRRQKFS
jgi:hypothetical protein